MQTHCRRLSIAAFVSAMTAAVLHAQATTPLLRAFDSTTQAFVEIEPLLDRLAKADVVIVGEQHDDPNTHLIERVLLDGLGKRRSNVVLSMEMFERDVQEPLDHFSMGHIDEPTFLKDARPWPNYATDYKPMVDLAIEKSWPVIAANVPRPIASEVSKGGLDVLASKSDVDKKFFATELTCPTDDDYFKRFGEAMGAHPMGGADASPAAERQTLERFYFAQCLKDETMAESIAGAYSAGAGIGKAPLVFHVTGAFHAEYGEGTTARVRRRLPDRKVIVVTIVPTADALASLAATDVDRARADVVIFTKTR